MADPLTIAIAAAMAGKAAEIVGGSAKEALVAIAKKVRARFRRPTDQAALAAAEKSGDPGDIAALQAVIQRVLQEDPALEREIRALAMPIQAGGDVTVFNFTGNADKNIQAQHIENLTIN